jgi:hypothetical protein
MAICWKALLCSISHTLSISLRSAELIEVAVSSYDGSLTWQQPLVLIADVIPCVDIDGMISISFSCL